MITRWQHWRALRKQRDEAADLLRLARRGLRRFGHRLNSGAERNVRAAIGAVDVARAQSDAGQLAEALAELRRLVDAHLAAAKKSPARELVESVATMILLALFLRAFVVEAFKIPSGSMIPTLEVGDFIFVNKFVYGLRLPFTDWKLTSGSRSPKRGDVVVFVFPNDHDKDFIKRVVAVAGDTVAVHDNVVSINGREVPRRRIDGDCSFWDRPEDENGDPSGEWYSTTCERWEETVEGNRYSVIVDPRRAPHDLPPTVVPPGSVFVLGDNRDNSNDSRFWGSVPLSLVKGKAMVVWWSQGRPEAWVRLRRLFHLVY